jgi:hypothetical protein
MTEKARRMYFGSYAAADACLFRQQMVSTMTRFLEIELEVGLTFARAATQSTVTVDVVHNRKLARKAYDTVSRSLGQADLMDCRSKKVVNRLQRLKVALFRLGDPPPE